jgi:hypothetical protein
MRIFYGPLPHATGEPIAIISIQMHSTVNVVVAGDWDKVKSKKQ